MDTGEEAARRYPETSKADSMDEAGDLSKQVRVIRETLGPYYMPKDPDSMVHF